MSGTEGWRQIASDPLVAILGYSFGPGTANALAIGVDGGVVIVSPPCRVSEPVFSATWGLGPVRALVAPNAFHHLGLAAWKARFPGAAVFAPAQSMARVAARSGVSAIRPLGEAGAICGGRVTLTDMPHYKTGEALIRIRTARGVAWYVTDVIFNMEQLPPHPVARLVFRLSRSAPGLRLNRIAPLFMIDDRAALYRWLRAEAERDSPRWLIPAHGEVADLSATPDRLLDLFGPTRPG